MSLAGEGNGSAGQGIFPLNGDGNLQNIFLSLGEGGVRLPRDQIIINKQGQRGRG